MVTQKISLTTAITALAAIGSHTGANADQQKTFNVDGFTGVNAARGIVVKVTTGPFALDAETNADDFSDLYVDVDDGVLEVRRKSAFSDGDDNHIRYKLNVSAPSLDFIKASTGATLKGEDLMIDDAKIAVDTGATMSLAGTCNTITVTANTGATFNGRNLLCANAIARARTGATIKAYASENADGKARMGGEVTFYGNPKNQSKGTFAGGAVRFE